MFKALGDPTRLRIFEFLRCCDMPVALENSGDVRPVDGPTVGDVCCHVTGIERITSTISFHLKELRSAELIQMEKRGKCMICSINKQAVAELSAYLLNPNQEGNDCC